MTVIEYLKEQVPDLEHCKRLRKKRFKHKPHYAWYTGGEEVRLAEYELVKVWTIADRKAGRKNTYAPAYTASELFSELMARGYVIKFWLDEFEATGKLRMYVVYGLHNQNEIRSFYRENLANVLVEILAPEAE